ncbi:MAG: PEGA domain-containing protein [Planctomycetia bacterium]|nr:PEGA domain-containing protein [Planctomycetia bacterium]
MTSPIAACRFACRPSGAAARGHGAAAGPPPLVVGCLLVAVLLVAATGCVQRRMTIRSNPPGALVYVDDYQIGTTPVSTDFIYYGTRKIRLVKDGYETLTVRQPFPIPWYEVFPLTDAWHGDAWGGGNARDSLTEASRNAEPFAAAGRGPI